MSILIRNFRLTPFCCAIAALLLAAIVAPWSAAASQDAASRPATEPASQGSPESASQAATETSSRAAKKKRITLASLGTRLNFDGTVDSGGTWLDDGRSYLSRVGGTMTRIDAESGESAPAYDEDAFAAALLAAGVPDEDARRKSRNPDAWSANRDVAMVRHGQAVLLYSIASRRAQTLGTLPEKATTVALNPAGDAVAFVLGNNLHVLDARGKGKPRQLTRDGSPTLLNGILDWVYQEEIYGRGTWRAHWWSADGAWIAFLQLDESRVPVYRLQQLTEARPKLDETNYPKAGDPNPTVRLGLVRVADGRLSWVDLSAYAAVEPLIVQVSWSPDGRVVYSVQDREQTWMELCDADPQSGASRRLLRESSPAWIENTGRPHWLRDGSFLWLSDRDGMRHMYRHARDGATIRRLTRGDWSVKSLHGSGDGWAYFSAAIDTPLESQVCRVSLLGGAVERLTAAGSSHTARFDAKCRYFFDVFSNISTPSRSELRRADGSLVRVLSENRVAALRDYELGAMELFRVPARDGRLLSAMLVKPADFDPARQYPVICRVYAGPGSPTVRNEWRSRSMIQDQAWASEGLLTWRIDPRSSSDESPLANYQAYQRLGELELADIEDSLRWLIARGFVDEKRIGITGHSYGGYMTTYALTHSDMFAVGIAGAPVTDWANYDTVYTERYMRTPANNPKGYEQSSVWRAASRLKGRLLLAHGLMDDNVHFQSSAQLIRELHRARKQFDLMVYPLDAHGFGNGDRHWRDMQTEFLRRHLLQASPPPTTAPVGEEEQ